MSIENNSKEPKMYSAKRLVFISYWSIVFFMSLITIIFIVFSFYKSRAYIEKNQMSNLNIIKYNFDSIFNEVETLVNSLHTNQTEKITCMQCADFYNPDQLNTIVDFQKDRNKVLSYSNCITELYLFNVKAKTVISDTIYHENMLDLVYNQLGIDGDTFYEELSGLPNTCYKVIYKGDTIDKIIYMECIYISSYKMPEGILIAEIPYGNIESVKKSLVEENTQVVLGWLSDFGFLYDSEIVFDDMEQTNCYPKKEYFSGVGLEKDVYSYVESDYAPIRYYYVSRYVDYIHEVIQLIFVGILDLIVAITGAIVISLYFGKRNFLPLQRIMTMLGHEEKDFSFQSMEREILAGLDKQIRLEKEIRTSRIGQIKQFIYQILCHKIINKDAINKAIHKWGLQFGDKLLVASIIFRDDFNQDDKELELMGFALNNICEECLNEKYKVYIIPDYDKLIILADLSKSQTIDMLQKDLDKIMAMSTEWFGIHTICAVSEQISSIYDIDEGYLQISAISEYCDIKGIEQGVITHEVLTKGKDIEQHSYYYKLNKYMNMILAQDYSAAESLFTDIYENDLNTDNNSVKHSRMRMIHLISMIVVPYKEAGGSFHMSDIETKKTLEELYAFGCNIFQSMMSENAVMMESVSESARQYIQKHALDYNINVASISEAIGVSASYLSRTFKKDVGVGVLDYLHRVRMVHAKALLKNGHTVVDVAAQTGYLDAKAFIRAFKRYEGITPGQFKNI